MRRRLAQLLLLLPLLAIGMGARGAEPMYLPPPIDLPDGAEPKAVSAAIRSALIGRGWSVDRETIPEGDGPREIVATLRVRVHTATIRLEFDAERIRIHYVSSDNLGFKEKKGRDPLIHPKYGVWIRNLENDVKAKLAMLAG